VKNGRAAEGRRFVDDEPDPRELQFSGACKALAKRPQLCDPGVTQERMVQRRCQPKWKLSKDFGAGDPT
jgi:hypothetical protein